jgi:hypothetical protein
MLINIKYKFDIIKTVQGKIYNFKHSINKTLRLLIKSKKRLWLVT